MKLTFRIHAIQRMFEREVSIADLHFVLERGRTIESYTDTHYPGRLVLGRPDRRSLHVVAADNLADDEVIIVTVYEPHPAAWQPGFKRRRP